MSKVAHEAALPVQLPVFHVQPVCALHEVALERVLHEVLAAYVPLHDGVVHPQPAAVQDGEVP